MASTSVEDMMPGGIDPTQKARLVRIPGSTLTFASFDPKAASAASSISESRKSSLHEELCRPKRIVIETSPNGESFWRFVPKARWEDGVLDEGVWPRVVDICGEMVHISHDQWDMYKLDAAYDCLVRNHTLLTVITRAEQKTNAQPHFNISSSTPPDSTPVNSKRRLSDSPRLRDLDETPTAGVQKRLKAVGITDEFSDDDDEVEVEDMVVDGLKGRRHQQSDRLRKVRANIEEARKRRREWNAQWKNKNTQLHEEYGSVASSTVTSKSEARSRTTSGSQREATGKRKAPDVFNDLRNHADEDWFETIDDDDDNNDDRRYDIKTPGKRTRTVSPEASRRAISDKRAERGKKRKEEMERRLRERMDAKQQAMMQDLFSAVPESEEPHTNGSVPHEAADPSEADKESDEDAARREALERSRQKMAELEADRPLWEEQARRRRAQEEEERRAAEAAKRRRTDAELKAAETQRKEIAAAQQAEAQSQQRAVDADMRRNREEALADARRDERQCAVGVWTASRALARYTALSEIFDQANFHAGATVVFGRIPWPVLRRPGTFGVEDIDWTSVEAFFLQVRRSLSLAEYKSLVERSHKRFHPDRWRARKILRSIEDEEEKECMEVAANTVAQALTPLWKEITGR